MTAFARPSFAISVACLLLAGCDRNHSETSSADAATLPSPPLSAKFKSDLAVATSVGAECHPAPPTSGECVAPANWLPKKTPPLALVQPAPHPAPDCPFYQDAWQDFLLATTPDAQGLPAFLSYPTIEDLFGQASLKEFASKSAGRLSLAVRDDKEPNVAQRPPISAGVGQAVVRDALVDQHGRPIYFAIHVNEAFRNFVRANGLTTVNGIRGADAGLEFPAGVLELKSAWQIVDDKAPPANFIVTPARVPWLRVVNKQVVVDPSHPSRDVTVALLGLHVVFTLPCHPEFIWSTFEHATNGVPDLAPPAPANPNDVSDSTDITRSDFLLFHGGTKAGAANQALDPTTFDEATQTFRSRTGVLQTSVYRAYPASKSNTTDEDDEVESINKSVGSLLGAAAGDRRSNYRLVGAVWLDRPDQSLILQRALINDAADPDIQDAGTDSLHSILGGEDGLSSMAMESFTQGFLPHCFTCHDARHVTRKGGFELVSAKKLNVSHVFSKFVEDNTPDVVDGGH